MMIREMVYEGFLWVAAGVLLTYLAIYGVIDVKTTSTLVGVLVGAVARQFGSAMTNVVKNGNGTNREIEAIKKSLADKGYIENA